MTDKRKQSGFLARAERVGQVIESAALVGVLAAMVLLAGAQIVLRNFMDSGFAWADEALRLMVLWVAMLGAVAASRDNRHIAIDALLRVLPGTPKAWTSVLVHAFTSAVAFTMAWFAWEFVAESREYGDLLLGDLPAWYFQSIIPVGFILIGYRYAIWFVRGLGDALPNLFGGGAGS